MNAAEENHNDEALEREVLREKSQLVLLELAFLHSEKHSAKDYTVLLKKQLAKLVFKFEDLSQENNELKCNIALDSREIRAKMLEDAHMHRIECVAEENHNDEALEREELRETNVVIWSIYHTTQST